MKYLIGFFFTIEDIEDPDKNFRIQELHYLAGRCLLDVIESLRVEPTQSRFAQLATAHTLRMVVICLGKLGREDILRRIYPQVRNAALRILSSQAVEPPYYGDDFWDWAYTVLCLHRVSETYPELERVKKRIPEQVSLLFENTKGNLDSGLALQGPNEWFGPAVPVGVYRALEVLSDYIDDKQALSKIKDELKHQALVLIENGHYKGREVMPDYYCWHYGQVVHTFPEDSTQQKELIKDLSEPMRKDVADRVYGLSRILQGAHAINDKDTFDAALGELYKCEKLGRFLGHGILGDTIKGSVNVLEALWPAVTQKQHDIINEMLDSLYEQHRRANRVGILVATELERDACVSEFRKVGAEPDRQESFTHITHEQFDVVVKMGKGISESVKSTAELIQRHGARWLIALGIAGSMGKRRWQLRKAGIKFVGPNKGDVVIATAVAPHRIREKVREEVENVGVPFEGCEWGVLPVHPKLFTIAHTIQQKEDAGYEIHEGLIVTGNGIRDNMKEKKRILKILPGSLAAEEEGYLVGLLANSRDIPFIVVRGVSDLAEGDKAKQKLNKEKEDEEQRNAASAAANFVVRLIQELSNHWYE